MVLPDGQNLDVEQVMVLAVEVEGNRGGIGKLTLVFNNIHYGMLGISYAL